jgi:exopolysaccharide biosynthesis polyprenyl glycosylphosphotransferase
MAEVSMPPVGELPGGLALPPAPRVAHHDDVVEADFPWEVDVPRVAGTRWLRPAVDVSASLLALAVVTSVVTVEPLVLATLAAVWPFLLAGSGRYARRPLGEPVGARLGRALRAGATLGLGCWVVHDLGAAAVAPHLTVYLVAALTLAALVAGLLPLPGETTTRLVLAGHPEDVRAAMAELATSRRFVVAAACVSARPDLSLGALPVQVGVSSAAELAARSRSDALLLLPGPDLTPATLRRLEWGAESAGIPLYVGTGLVDVAPTRVSVVQGAGLDVMQVRAAPARGPRRLLKDVVERLLAALALVLVSPVLLAVWALVRAETPGPGFFRQQRVGRGGAEFTMLKFRTMTMTTPEDREALAAHNQVEGGVLFKIRSDPRTTRFGGVLRRYSIDELPQLWNVVTGQMSLVGPRPALPEEVERYDSDPRRRLAVKPGITGLWQVSGRSDLSWEESVRLDLRYVDNWSLALDVAILCRTVQAVLGHRGAY